MKKYASKQQSYYTLCPQCKLPMQVLHFRPTISGRYQHTNIGFACHRCLIYIITNKHYKQLELALEQSL